MLWTIDTGSQHMINSLRSASPKLRCNSGAGLEQMSEILLEITAEGTAKKLRKKSKSERPTSPSSGSSSSSRSASPDIPGGGANQAGHGSSDDSLHPSPELPHRAVCARPDAVDLTNEKVTDTSVIVSGGNLGGVANKGFAQDDEIDDEKNYPDTELEKNSELESESQVDCGYTRNRDLSQLVDGTLHEVNELNTRVQSSLNLQSIDDTKELPPILFFLHGIGGSADSWNSQLG